MFAVHAVGGGIRPEQVSLRCTAPAARWSSSSWQLLRSQKRGWRASWQQGKRQAAVSEQSLKAWAPCSPFALRGGAKHMITSLHDECA